MKKPATFPQGTQPIARIGEISTAGTVDGPVTDAELASAFVGQEAPVEARRTQRITSAYTTKPVVGERPILTVA